MLEMDVSIIIPAYQRTVWLGKSLERLLDQSFSGSFEVIVVDDGSPNKSEIKKCLDSFLNRKDILVKYIRNSHSGPAAARNHGVKFSSGDILCFIDDDSMAERNWLAEIVKSFTSKESPGVVNGNTLSFDREAKLPLLLERAVYSGKNWATCNIAYRKDVFASLGGFDETFLKASWEDNDLGIRAKWRGVRHIYNENAIVYHKHESTIDEYKRKCLLNGEGAAVFSRKYFFRKPLWGIGTPLMMGRRLLYIFAPAVWARNIYSEKYLKFLWSFYSLKGFFLHF